LTTFALSSNAKSENPAQHPNAALDHDQKFTTTSKVGRSLSFPENFSQIRLQLFCNPAEEQTSRQTNR